MAFAGPFIASAEYKGEDTSAASSPVSPCPPSTLAKPVAKPVKCRAKPKAKPAKCRVRSKKVEDCPTALSKPAPVKCRTRPTKADDCESSKPYAPPPPAYYAAPTDYQVKVAAPVAKAYNPPASTPTPAGNSTAQAYAVPSEMTAVLKKHNDLRNKHGAQPLVWDSNLAHEADELASSCRMRHDAQGNVGQNLYQGGNPVSGVQSWYDENQSFRYGRSDYSSSTGHFTQIVWKDTKKIGCAYKCSILVCNYFPAGNIMGNFDANVKPPSY